jgi:hypothetical protein
LLPAEINALMAEQGGLDPKAFHRHKPGEGAPAKPSSRRRASREALTETHLEANRRSSIWRSEAAPRNRVSATPKADQAPKSGAPEPKKPLTRPEGRPYRPAPPDRKARPTAGGRPMGPRPSFRSGTPPTQNQPSGTQRPFRPAGPTAGKPIGDRPFKGRPMPQQPGQHTAMNRPAHSPQRPQAAGQRPFTPGRPMPQQPGQLTAMNRPAHSPQRPQAAAGERPFTPGRSKMQPGGGRPFQGRPQPSRDNRPPRPFHNRPPSQPHVGHGRAMTSSTEAPVAKPEDRPRFRSAGGGRPGLSRPGVRPQVAFRDGISPVGRPPRRGRPFTADVDMDRANGDDTEKKRSSPSAAGLPGRAKPRKPFGPARPFGKGKPRPTASTPGAPPASQHRENRQKPGQKPYGKPKR